MKTKEHSMQLSERVRGRVQENFQVTEYPKYS